MIKSICIKYIFIYISLTAITNKIFTNANVSNSLLNFRTKSIYFTSLNEGFTASDAYKLENESHKPHKTDTVIIKLEKQDKIHPEHLDFNNNLSILITQRFYKIVACLNPNGDITENNFDIRYDYQNFFPNFVKVSENNKFCYRKQDYFDLSFTSRRKSNMHLDVLNKDLYSTEEIEYAAYYANTNIKKLLDINLDEYTELIKSFYSDFIMWNEHSYYELAFIYDPYINKFLLNKIFIYFSYPPSMIKELEKLGKFYFITLIKNGLKIFDNIFIHYRNVQKIMKYSKNYKESGKEKLTISDFSDNLLNLNIKISTQSESIFHNLLTIKFNEQLIQSFRKNFQNGAMKQNELCFFVYQHLTEDTYIEKNEFRNYLNNKYPHPQNKIEYLYSSFIDQELSSDLVDQYFTSFIMCDELSHFKEANYELSYPVHFRYQPTLPSTTDKYFQDVSLPHPFFQILPKNNTIQVPELSQILFDSYLFSLNIFDKDPYFVKIKREHRNQKSDIDKFNERRIFNDEILLKLKFFVNDYNFYLINQDDFLHQIPAGRGKDLMLVIILTCIVTMIGFFIILYGLVIYLIFPNDEEETYKGEIQEKSSKVLPSKSDLLKED